MNRKWILCTGAFVAFLLVAPTAWAAPMGAAGYSVSYITTPGAATGDVYATGGAVFTGVGAFGVGTQSVVRIDGGGTTVLADGFNSLGGFAYDATNNRLIVGDNAGDQSGTLTGDTIYGITNPFGSPGSPASAASLELLASGSIPGYADVILDPNDATGNTLFISDASASFPPAGRVIEVLLSTSAITDVQTGLSFAAGIATDGTTLFVGDALLDWTGDVSDVPLSSVGDSLSLITNLPFGIYELEVSSDGSLLVTSGGAIYRIDPTTGATTTVATGFGFATGLHEGADGTIYALDGFAAPGETDRVWVIAAVPEPGTAVLLGGGLVVFAARRRFAARAH